MWLKSLLCVLLAVIVIQSNASPDWHQFKAVHGKTYSSKAEEVMRKELYLKSDLLIKKHNSEAHHWKMKHTKFSDMTSEEKQKYFGLKLPENFNEEYNSLELFEGDSSVELPEEVDYSWDDECMAPVKDQLACGSCWAFSAINPLEFANCKKNNNELTILSEQHLVDCVYQRRANPSGCVGGSSLSGFKYVMNAQGIATNSSYPYKAEYSGKCEYTAEMKGAQITKYQRIGGDTPADVVKNMMQALVMNSTVAVDVYVTKEWSHYGWGVYFNTTDCDKTTNHAMNVVGYGTLMGNDYWVVRNSWGADWGDHGYIMMRRGVNQCRIEGNPFFVSVA